MKIYLILTAILCAIALLLPAFAVGFKNETNQESTTHAEQVTSVSSSR